VREMNAKAIHWVLGALLIVLLIVFALTPFTFASANTTELRMSSIEIANLAEAAGNFNMDKATFLVEAIAPSIPYVELSHFKFDMMSPGKPLGLLATPGNGKVTLSWSAPADQGTSAIISYEIYRGETAGTIITKIAETSANYPLTYNDTTVTNEQRYWYEAEAKSAIGSSPRSDPSSATPSISGTAPSETTSVIARGNPGSIVVTWGAPSDSGSGVDYYKVCRSASRSSRMPFVYWRPNNVFVYNDTEIIPDVEYLYTVYAVNTYGQSWTSIVDLAMATPRMGTPSFPLNITAIPGSGRVTLTWSAPSSDGGAPIIAYNVYRGGFMGGLGPGEMSLIAVGDFLTYTDTNLTNGQDYFYRVSAFNSAGDGELTGRMVVTPTQPSDNSTFLIIVLIAAVAIAAIGAAWLSMRKKK
jgi:hypothetical protein